MTNWTVLHRVFTWARGDVHCCAARAAYGPIVDKIEYLGWGVAFMRGDFRVELREISQALGFMAESVCTAMRHATAALLDVDPAAAGAVVAYDVEVDALYRIVEDKVYSVVARQAPVASDLRLLLTALHIAVDLERMGDMAEHVARATLRRRPDQVVPEPLIDIVREMGEVADRMAGKIAAAIVSGRLVSSVQFERDDDAMDALHRKLFGALVEPDWTFGVEAAIDMALLGQFYERYGDHVVNVARQVAFFVTGEKVGKSA